MEPDPTPPTSADPPTDPYADAAAAPASSAEPTATAASYAPPTPEAEPAEPRGHQSGYVAIVGAPNVGKSTLLNRWLGTKLSIVSPRPSTTRNRVLGILTAEAGEQQAHPAGYQLVLLDTPGVVRPKYRLHQHMMRDVDRSLGDADVTVFMADATERRLTHDAQSAAERVAGRRAARSCWRSTRSTSWDSSTRRCRSVELYTEAMGRPPEAVVPISARHGTGTDALMRAGARAHPARARRTTRPTSSRSTRSGSLSPRSSARPSSTSSATRSRTRPRSWW